MVAEIITTISPTTQQPVVTRHGLSPEAILELGPTAQAAFRSYRKSHPDLKSRQQIITKALELLTAREDVLAKELTEQMGRPIAYTAKEIQTAVKRAQYMNRIAPEILENPIPGDAEPGFKRYLKREPVGTVLVLFAWNYPYLILVNSLIPALLAGNSLILKPSPQTPTIVEHVAEIFTQAGLPKDVIQYLHCGSPMDLAPLIRSPLIDHICFTGSVAAGLEIQQIASNRFVNVGLELGGKDPAYVRPDVDLAWAAEEIVDGAIFNSGQSCCSIERVYVHESVYDAFIKEAKTVLSGYKLGDPRDPATQIGPVVSVRAKATIKEQIKDAMTAGAIDDTPDNESFKRPQGPEEGNFVAPVLLTNVNHSMSVMRDETFGPVIPVQKVSGDEEAVKLMNDSQFGLTASVWTRDMAKGEELVQLIEAGTVFVNRADYPSPDLAWTGWKDSGKGITLSRLGFEQFVKVKSVHLKDYPK